MSRYKEADFEEDDASSMGSVPLAEVSATPVHIRYAVVSKYHLPVATNRWM